MTGARDLMASERGVLCIALVIAATVLVVTGKLTGIDWLTFAKWIAVTLVASKTVTGALETMTKNGTAEAPPAP